MAHDLALPALELSDPASVPARPLLDRYLFEQRISMAAAGRRLGRSKEMVRLYCLPFDDPGRFEPPAAVRSEIAAWTRDAVPGWSFDDTPQARAAFFNPPWLNAGSPAESPRP